MEVKDLPIIYIEILRLDNWDGERMQVFIDGFLWEARWTSEGG